MSGPASEDSDDTPRPLVERLGLGAVAVLLAAVFGFTLTGVGTGPIAAAASTLRAR